MTNRALAQAARALDSGERWYRGLNRWERAAVSLWGAALVFICCRVALSSLRTHNEYLVFAEASRNWLAGRDLYQPAFDPYRYSPLVAAVLVPLGVLPDRLGSILWRLLNAGVYLAALLWWIRAALPHGLNRTQVALVVLLVAPLSIGNLNNGQSNALLLGLLLAAITAVDTERWNLGAALVAAACLLKLYPLAIGLLLATVYPRRFAGRLVAALAVGLGLPFLFQRPAYVAAQYAEWWHRIVGEPRYGQMEFVYRDLRLLSRVWLAPMGSRLYLALQLLSAAAIAAVCLGARRRQWPRPHLLALLFGLGCCWMTVFGLATQSTTYMLLAPTLAWALLESRLERGSLGVFALLLCSYGLLVAAQLAGLVPGMAQPVSLLGVQPLAGLLLLAALLLTTLRGSSSVVVRYASIASPAEGLQTPGRAAP